MDDKTLNEYIQKLPQSVQDLISDNVWESRTIEIAKKYALGPEQSETLVNTTLLVLVGIEKPDTFLNTIISDLGISKLLAEQVMEDLDNRVFEYALNSAQSKEIKTPEKTTAQKFPGSLKINPQIPELKPQNLPIQTNSPIINSILDKQLEAQKSPSQPRVSAEVIGINTPKYTSLSTQKPIVGFETKAPAPIQKAQSVPRFNADGVIEDDFKPAINPSTEKTPEKAMQSPVEPNNPATNSESTASPSKKYSLDPYREPLA